MPCRRAGQAVTSYEVCWSDDVYFQEVALALVWARLEVNGCEVSVTSSEDEPHFPMGWVRVFAYNCWLGCCSS